MHASVSLISLATYMPKAGSSQSTGKTGRKKKKKQPEVQQDQTLCLFYTKRLLILQHWLNVISKTGGKAGRLGSLVLRRVGRAVGGALQNPFQAQLRWGTGGQGFPATEPTPPCHRGPSSLLPMLLTLCEVLKYWIASRCFTSTWAS